MSKMWQKIVSFFTPRHNNIIRVRGNVSTITCPRPKGDPPTSRVRSTNTRQAAKRAYEHAKVVLGLESKQEIEYWRKSFLNNETPNNNFNSENSSESELCPVCKTGRAILYTEDKAEKFCMPKDIGCYFCRETLPVSVWKNLAKTYRKGMDN